MTENNSLVYRFYISIDSEGNQEPYMRFGFHEKHKHLVHLARGHLTKSKGVKEELAAIEMVLEGSKEMHSFGGDEWCIVDFKKDKSTILNFFDEFDPFELNSSEIHKLLIDWNIFLTKYENGKIPGITLMK